MAGSLSNSKTVYFSSKKVLFIETEFRHGKKNLRRLPLLRLLTTSNRYYVRRLISDQLEIALWKNFTPRGTR